MGPENKALVTLDGDGEFESITCGGQEVAPWVANFVRLPKYRYDGEGTVLIKYAVRETEFWGSYEPRYTGGKDYALDGETITNEEMTAPPVSGDHLRVKGSSRFDTAIQAANYMKEVKGISEFTTVIVANGMNFADALSGSYLAAVAEAPILLVNPDSEELVAKYIKDNVDKGGTVYLLGGSKAVSDDFAGMLTGFEVIRLGGKTRYDTNVQILEAANAIDGSCKNEVLVCSGTNFADALSTSSVGKPILLVGTEISDVQQQYLTDAGADTAWIIGGDKAVSADIEAALKEFVPESSTKRVKGKSRFDTSYEVAKEFFPGSHDTAVLVYGMNFPDGLSGGAVAAVIGAPVLLAMDNEANNASVAPWVAESGATNSVTFGGAKLIPDDAIRTIMNQPDAEIILFE